MKMLKYSGVLSGFLLAAASNALVTNSASAADGPGLSPALAQNPPYACLRNFYVDGVNGHDQKATTRGQASDPWKSITGANASGTLKAGDCVNVLPGTYLGAPLNNFTMELTVGGTANTATGYIVYRSTVPQAAKVAGIHLQRPFVVLDGFDFDGTMAVDANGTVLADNGVHFGCLSHHITLLNNVIHGFRYNGVLAQWGDFITIDHNVIYGNATSVGNAKADFDGIGPNGGIQVYQPQPPEFCDPSHVFYKTAAADANVTYRIAITNNLVQSNIDDTRGLFTAAGAAIPDRDGHGIVIEDSSGSETVGRKPYAYKSLVMGNLATGNGAAGILVHRSANVTVASNSATGDWTDPRTLIVGGSEIMTIGDTGLTLSNNQIQ